MEIVLDSVQCKDFEVSSRREWLTTNGIGGYASGTVSGAHTRRYHGLLVAALNPPTERYVLLSNLDERIEMDGQEFFLSAHQYPNAVFPQGYLHLNKFRLSPQPTWEYSLPKGVSLVKKLWMTHGQNTTYITYEIKGSKPIRLTIIPLIAYKQYHTEMKMHPGFPLDVSMKKEAVEINYDCQFPPLRILAPNASFVPADSWYYQFEHLRERDRGLDAYEDLYNPLSCTYFLKSGETAVFIATAETRVVQTDAVRTRELETERLEGLANQAGFKDPTARLFARSADAFIVNAGDRETIIAGYHWFTDWGRDTMISLPGLCLSVKQFDIARNILLSYAKYLYKGLLPNRFPDKGDTPEYNTVDATLWYAHAIYCTLQSDWNQEFAQAILPVLQQIALSHQKGTLYNIHVDTDDLLWAGEPGVQLTWMDAKIGDWVVTPRTGKPVEINALWINLLRVIQWLSEKLGKPSQDIQAQAELAEASFREKFWCERTECFYDVIGSGEPDASIRPNQVLAISLPFAPATESQARSALTVMQTHLLTPFGLRTLSPDDPNYKGSYGGSPETRDAAYHQGTVWPWLLGPFISAYVKTTGDRAGARRMLSPMRQHLKEAGLGQISEIFEGDPPHQPVGCIAQAWSLAEILRVWVEELGNK